MTVATSVECKNISNPDEVRPFAGKGQAEVVNINGREVIRGTFEPGWRWSDHVKPLANTESCQAAHFGFCQAGNMKIVMDDGTETEVGPGDCFSIPPGHDAWTVGDQNCVLIDFGDVAGYAKHQH